ncbi:hypothetical protein AAF712_001090 [Marasmius tenuissimus]|uniref:PXA domain-containing protein n=1 Tax=Marasmius tenuissimus TaxID=585030 RepID=A0ABR3AFK7_9AGAR
MRLYVAHDLGMPPSFRSQQSQSTLAHQAQSSNSLSQRLLFPNGIKREVKSAPSDSLPPLFATPVPNELTEELYDFIALALRAFVLPWWSKITRYDKEFLPQINHILTNVFCSLESRILSQPFNDELPGLIFEDIPTILTQHYEDFRNAQRKIDSAYASGGSLSLPKLFHQLQPHMGVDSEGKVNHEYIRQVIDHILRVSLPEEDYGPEAERFIVREIVVKIVAEDVLPKVTKPWFIYKIILDLIDDKARAFPPSLRSLPTHPSALQGPNNPPSPTQVAQTRSEAIRSNDNDASKSSSSGPLSSLLILLLSTIQSISGACLALVHAYKQVVLTVKQVNAASSTHSARLGKTEEESKSAQEIEQKRTSFVGAPLERTRSASTHRSSVSMHRTPTLPGDTNSVSRVSSTSSSLPSTSSAFPRAPSHPNQEGSKDDAVHKSRTRGYAYPSLALVSEIFMLNERHASRTIMGTTEMLLGALNAEGFVDR